MITSIRRVQYFLKSLAWLIPVVCAVSGMLNAETKSNGVGTQFVASTNRGQIIFQDNWNYAVTAMNDNGTYKMWWCGGLPNNNDNVWYASSTDPDGMNWVGYTRVMASSPFALACDPSVVKVGTTYYMYFTGTYDPRGINNAIYLATSADGINWTRYPNDSSPLPIIPNLRMDGSYGIGQPSVLCINGQFIMYYTDSGGTPDGLYRATSSDGIIFTGSTFIMTINDVDVKYNSTSNIYIMVRGGQSPTGLAALHVSTDGFNWTPVGNSKYILMEPTPGNQMCAGPGLMGSPIGEIGSASWAFCGHGNPQQPGTWRIFKSDFYYYGLIPNAMYRYATSILPDHFYALDPNSPNYYTFEQIAYRALSPSDKGATPFFRLRRSNPPPQHFYTANPVERDQAIALYGYIWEGNEGYVASTQVPGTIPLYRVVNYRTGDNIYTTSTVERDNAIRLYGYTDAGIYGYVFPSP